MASAASAWGRDVTDFDTYYRQPLTIAVEFDSMDPPEPDIEVGARYDGYEISGTVRYSFAFLPMLQPLVKGGIYQYTAEPSQWSHLQWWGAAGVGLHHKFSKSFELGADLSLGFSEAILSALGDPSGSSWGSPHFVAELAGVVAFSPSFSLSLFAKPSIRYMRSLTIYDHLNGFTLGVGFGVAYRTGEDPDAPQAMVRAITLDSAEIQPVFAAMQSYYVGHPIGKATIKNIEKYPLYDVTVSFFQEGYMDSPTKAATFSEIKSGESKQFDLTASFNDRVFTVVGETPLNAKVAVDYIMRNKPVTQSFSTSYTLHDKTNLTWDDLGKVAAFITPADSALRNYTSFVRQAAKNDLVPSLNAEIQIAMQVYNALTALGVLYQSDPKAPFTSVQGDPVYVDSISIPRDTLKRITGDCDDLTVLFCSLLETVGVETAYITTPGHIFAAFNTKVSPQEYRAVNPDRSTTVILNNEIWVPVEITMIGTEDFITAWETAAAEYAAYEAEPDKRAITVTREAQNTYKPIGLTETDLGVQYGVTRDALVSGFTRDAKRLVDAILDDYVRTAKETQNKKNFNTLGIKAAEFGRYPMAEDAFNTALSLDRNYLPPQVNLGNLLFLKQDYQDALKVLHQAEELMREQGDEGSSSHAKVLLSIAKCYYELESFEKAEEYFKKAAAEDPSLGKTAQYLGRATDGARAARVESLSVNFVDDAE